MKNNSKKYTEKQLEVAKDTSYQLGIIEGKRLQREQDSNNAQIIKLQQIHARYESVNKLLSMAGQYQETITKLVMAAEKQL